jgi:hypothetical protein
MKHGIKSLIYLHKFYPGDYMKKLLAGLLLTTFCASASANCIYAYEDAAIDRETRNNILTVVGVAAAAIAIAVLTDDDTPSRPQTNRERQRQIHRNRYNRRTYGTVYISTSSSSDDRWFGSNNFDKVLIAYNDAVMAYSQNVARTYSSELNELNKKVAKKVIRMARRQGVLGSVRDIKSDRDLTKDEDLLVVRDELMSGMEQNGANSFCPGDAALKRVDVIAALAQKVINNRN